MVVSRSTHLKHNKVQPHLSINPPLPPPPILLCRPHPCHHDLVHSSNSLTQLPHRNRIFMTCQGPKSNDRTRSPTNWTSLRTPKVDRVDVTRLGLPESISQFPRTLYSPNNLGNLATTFFFFWLKLKTLVADLRGFSWSCSKATCRIGRGHVGSDDG